MKKSEQLRIAAQIEEAIENGQPVEWQHFIGSKWIPGFGTPAGSVVAGAQIRITPKIIVINGFEVPEPLRQAPARDSLYCVVDTSIESSFCTFTWNNDTIDNLRLARGIIHATGEAARLHAKALLSFTEAG